MKRRTFRKLRATQESAFHHHVYVVLLDSKAFEDPRFAVKVGDRDPSKPYVYVGMTGLDPRQRLENHKNGIKAARIVKKYGLRLMPDLYECLNPMPYEAAVQMERDLAADLRSQGFAVAGGT